MIPAVVCLPELNRGDDRVYRLNWLGKVRRQGRRFEVFARFVAEPCPPRPARHFDAWIKLTDFPFLIAGSRWFRGVMIGKPLSLRTIRLASTKIVALHSLSKVPREGALCLGSIYPLSFDSPAAPVAEFEAAGGMRVFAGVPELYRSHYFGIPIALPSVLHGLHRGALANRSIAAWDNDLTHWLDRAGGVAQIAPSKRLRTRQTAYLARLLFSESGRRTLDALQNWVTAHFTQWDPATRLEAQLLPCPLLPYTEAVWEASVLPLPRDRDGRAQVLVTHIESFEAPEPYRELVQLDPYGESAGQGNDAAGSCGRGQILEPVVEGRLDDLPTGWDPALEPVVIADVATKDKAARRRVPSRIKREALPEAVRGRAPETKRHPTTDGSTELYGPRGTGVAPIAFSDDEPWPERDGSLDVAYEAMRSAIAEAVACHQAVGIASYAHFLPDDTHAFAFAIKRNGQARAPASPRQFLVAAVRLGSRHALVLEAQRRSTSECLPLGIVWKVGEQAFAPIDTADLYEVVRHLEAAAANGHSWTRLEGLREQYRAMPVRHPAANLSGQTAIARFRERILARLIEAIGDARAVAAGITNGAGENDVGRERVAA